MARKRKGERPDGLIQVSLQIGYKQDGRPDRKYFYGHTRAEAEKKRDEYKRRIQDGLKMDPNITVRQWVDMFLTTYRTRVNEAYLENDAAPYKRLVNEIGRMKVVDVTEADLQRALNKVGGMSFSTVDKYHQAIKRVFKRAVKNKLIKDSPAEDLIVPNSVKGSHRALERWEVELILANWDTPAARMGLAVMIMLLCGLRRGELIALEWSAVDMVARTLSVRQVAIVKTNQVIIEQRAKTDAGLRTLPICQALYDALNTVPIEKREGYVCKSAKGTVLSESSASRGLESFCRVLERILNGEPASAQGRRKDYEERERKKNYPPDTPRKEFKFTYHDLRHTYATALYDAGVPVKAAQYFLGHADIKITLDLYTHLSREREAASRNQMVQYLDSWLDDRVRSVFSMGLPAPENKPDFPEMW
ncbi:MAG: site-specific integrase [Clostridia bacterium]|nr:site-specific integrase [Clostridia bacterium]